ncbi:MAG TPA: putative metalloprotease CJM1_0395 family protein [Oculatellaceae cyanobacterium]|jgi:hypothetical protein
MRVSLGPDIRSLMESRLAAARRDSYNEVMTHEMQHKSAAGPYAGGIVINYDKNGIAVGGHVPIAIPALNPQNPEGSLQAFKMIRNAALAPADPSGADRSVAATAQALIGKAQVLMAKKAQQQKAQSVGNQ